jgi:hypothetical protein
MVVSKGWTVHPDVQNRHERYNQLHIDLFISCNNRSISLQCFQALPVFIYVAVTQQRETRNSSFQRIVFVTPIQSAVEKGHCDKVTLIEKQYYVYYVILLGFSCVAKP